MGGGEHVKLEAFGEVLEMGVDRVRNFTKCTRKSWCFVARKSYTPPTVCGPQWCCSHYTVKSNLARILIKC